jgi:phosphate transport system permease protein
MMGAEPFLDRLLRRGVHAAAFASLAIFAFAIAILLFGSVDFLRDHNVLETLLGTRWQPLAGQLQIGRLLAETAVVTLLAMMGAVPFGLAVAVFGALVASAVEATVLRWVLTVAAAVPSVAYGWWGLAVVVPALRGIGWGAGYSLFAASLVLGLMLLPTFSVLALDALMKVPEDWHQASLALGASDDQNVVCLVLPASLSGLRTALFTALARAVGETMAVQMVIGGSAAGFHGLLGPGATLGTQILTDLAIFPPSSPNHGILDVMALVLFGSVTLLTGWVGARPGRGSA